MLRPLLACTRLWAKARALSGMTATPNAYSWSLMATYVMQRAGCLPLLRADSDAFARLLEPAAAAAAAAAAAGAAAGASAASAAAAAAAAGGGAACATGGAACAPPASPAALGSSDGPSEGPASAAAWRQLAAVAASSFSADCSLERVMASASVRSPSATSPLAAAARSPSAGGGGAADEAAERTLGQLLWHFFITWASEFAYKRHVASLRHDELPKAAKGWCRRDEQALMLEDPVEIVTYPLL